MLFFDRKARALSIFHAKVTLSISREAGSPSGRFAAVEIAERVVYIEKRFSVKFSSTTHPVLPPSMDTNYIYKLDRESISERSNNLQKVE